ncbi:hypothetical protein MXB_547 [Myxobolus squamalis]|nr:hypothetical protein MXB_547 [Myxobolus squamalis]
MDTIIVNVRFKLDNVSVPKKSYEINIHLKMAKFKEILIQELENLAIRIPREKLINFGFARIDSYNRIVYFLNDQVQAATLANSIGMSIPNLLMKYKEKLIEAIKSEDVSAISKYLSKGLDPNFNIAGTILCPIYVWCFAKPCLQEAILNMLLDNELFLDFRNQRGECAIHLAISAESRNSLKLLYLKGASFSEYDINGIPALFYALDKDRSPNFLEYILELSRDLSIQDCSGNNSLHYCVKKGLTNHLVVILKYARNNMDKKDLEDLISSQNIAGNTPIHLCVLENQKSCLEQLMKSKASLEQKNRSGFTSIDLAEKAGEWDIIRMLKNPLYASSIDIDRPGKIFTNKESLEQYRTYACSLRKPMTSRKSIPNLYPGKYSVVTSYSSCHPDELCLQKGQSVFVFLILKSQVAFGYKLEEYKKVYGWFPAYSINMADSKKISYFQCELATLECLTQEIPNLNNSCKCTFFPVMIFVNLAQNDIKLGLEIACKELPPLSDACQDTLILRSSPFYVRNVVPDSPVDQAGMRIGDQILYIMSNDITLFPIKTVTAIIKRMSTAKIPSNLPKTTVRQICFIVLRHKDVSLLDTDAEDYPELHLYKHRLSELPHPTTSTLQYSPLEINSNYYHDCQSLSGFSSQFGSSGRSVHLKPLPSIPESSLLHTIALKEEAIPSSSSDEYFPPPPPDMLFD